jgi:hypothetical protein
MRTAALACAVTCAAVAVLAAPAQGARYVAELQVPQHHHGGGVLVSGDGKEVSITRFGAFRSPLSARYSGPGRTTRQGLSGRLGRFGSVRLHFAPEGKPRRTTRPKSCTGGPRVWVAWDGTFTGTVRFAPDANLHGFTRTGTFKGSVQNVPRWHCQGQEWQPEFDPHAGGVVVDALNCDGRSFQATVEVKPATALLPGEPATTAGFAASWTKSVGIAEVTYAISVEGGPDTAVFSDDLSEGTITPPPPFHGEAKIVKQGKSWTWTGSLSARFPGQTVNLTGDGFKAYAMTFKPRPSTAFLFAVSERC